LKLLHNIGQLVTCRAEGGQGEIHAIADAGLVWEGETIRWVGPIQELPPNTAERSVWMRMGRWWCLGSSIVTRIWRLAAGAPRNSSNDFWDVTI